MCLLAVACEGAGMASPRLQKKEKASGIRCNSRPISFREFLLTFTFSNSTYHFSSLNQIPWTFKMILPGRRWGIKLSSVNTLPPFTAPTLTSIQPEQDFSTPWPPSWGHYLPTILAILSAASSTSDHIALLQWLIPAPTHPDYLLYSSFFFSLPGTAKENGTSMIAPLRIPVFQSWRSHGVHSSPLPHTGLVPFHSSLPWKPCPTPPTSLQVTAPLHFFIDSIPLWADRGTDAICHVPSSPSTLVPTLLVFTVAVSEEISSPLTEIIPSHAPHSISSLLLWNGPLLYLLTLSFCCSYPSAWNKYKKKMHT